MEAGDVVGRAIPRVRQRDAERHDAVGPEPGVDGAQLLEAAEHESRPDEQHGRHRDLRDDEQLSQRVRCVRSVVDARSPPRSIRRGVTARCRMNGHDPEHERDRGGDERRARQHGRRRCARPPDAGRGPERGVAAALPRIQASRPPSAPPATSSIALSASDCASRCPRSAPNAMRSAISRRRASARTSSRLATFTQAMSRTSPIIAHNVQSTGRTLPTTSSRYGRTSAMMPASRSVLTARKSTTDATRGSSCVSSRVACSGVTPARSRAMPGR